MDLFNQLRASGVRICIGDDGKLHVPPPITDEVRATITAHRDELVGQVRAADQDEVGLLELLDEMVEDVAAVNAARATRLRDHIEPLLRTDLERARSEVARCWTALLRCDLPELPEAHR